MIYISTEDYCLITPFLRLQNSLVEAAANNLAEGIGVREEEVRTEFEQRHRELTHGLALRGLRHVLSQLTVWRLNCAIAQWLHGYLSERPLTEAIDRARARFWRSGDCCRGS